MSPAPNQQIPSGSSSTSTNSNIAALLRGLSQIGQGSSREDVQQVIHAIREQVSQDLNLYLYSAKEVQVPVTEEVTDTDIDGKEFTKKRVTKDATGQPLYETKFILFPSGKIEGEEGADKNWIHKTNRAGLDAVKGSVALAITNSITKYDLKTDLKQLTKEITKNIMADVVLNHADYDFTLNIASIMKMTSDFAGVIFAVEQRSYNGWLGQLTLQPEQIIKSEESIVPIRGKKGFMGLW